MLETWLVMVLPVLLGTLGMACNQMGRRFMMKDGVFSPLQFSTHLFLVASLYFGAVYLAVWGFIWPQTLPGFWRALMGGTLANIGIQYLAIKAVSYPKGEVSLTSPLMAMTPGLLTILALFLGEFPGKAGCFGIFLMIFGSYIIIWSKPPEKLYQYFAPLQRLLLLAKIGRLSPDEREKTIVVSLSLGSAFLGTFGLLFDGLLTRRATDMQGLTFALMVLCFLLAVSFAGFYMIYPDAKNEAQKYFGLRAYKQKKYLIGLAILGLVWLWHIYAINPVYSHAYVAYVGTLKRFSVLLAVIGGYLVFKEGDIKKRLLAAVLIILGVIFISMDGLPERVSAQVQLLGL